MKLTSCTKCGTVTDLVYAETVDLYIEEEADTYVLNPELPYAFDNDGWRCPVCKDINEKED